MQVQVIKICEGYYLNITVPTYLEINFRFLHQLQLAIKNINAGFLIGVKREYVMIACDICNQQRLIKVIRGESTLAVLYLLAVATIAQKG